MRRRPWAPRSHRRFPAVASTSGARPTATDRHTGPVASARTVLVVGIGVGDPGQLTAAAVAAIARADVVVLLDKGVAAALTAYRQGLLDRHARPDCQLLVIDDPPRDRTPADYDGEVRDWHAARARAVAAALAGVPAAAVVAFLVWGDPSLYDSTLRVLNRLDPRPMVEVVPGITAVQALTAAHGVTLNRVGAPVVITTGRRLAAEGMPADDVVVMLDAHEGWATLDPAVEIFWGGCLGTADQELVRGRVGEVGPEITRVRAELKARTGWVMDIYLLRRPA